MKKGNLRSFCFLKRHRKPLFYPGFTILRCSSGFTIVELLVVIVVIGILAAITIVSYTGISSRANASALQSDLTNVSNQLKMYQIDHSAYPTSLNASNCPLDSSSVVDNTYCLKPTSGNSLLYSSNNNSNPQTFSLYAINNSTSTKYRTTDSSIPTIATPVVATGGTITNTGGYRIHTFTTSGTFTVSSGDNVEVLVVGGGGGGSSGGGGAGGLIYNSYYPITPQFYAIAIGNGGIGCAPLVGGCSGGQNSVFGSLSAIGGGNGGRNDSAYSATVGGSGGGGGSTSTAQDNGGAGTVGQGNTGGTVPSIYFLAPFPSAGGGGAGGVGSNPTGASISGNGGVGLAYSISGVSAYYAGGGGGGAWGGGTHGTGGIGGGGGGATVSGIAGTANTGGGGSGVSGYNGNGGTGGSGIVIIRYPN